MRKIVLATGNAGKISELSAILKNFECIAQTTLGIESIAETGLSFIENAIIKARHASLKSGYAALADDSGLVVEALHGDPGIYSSRFAGENATDAENIALLLEKLQETPQQEQRQAFFYCAIVIVRHATDPIPIIACGNLKGYIANSASGINGFGYDPVFYLPDYKCTMAELADDVKNKISHRAKALNELMRK